MCRITFQALEIQRRTKQITSPALLEFMFQSRETDSNHLNESIYRPDGDESPLFMD